MAIKLPMTKVQQFSDLFNCFFINGEIKRVITFCQLPYTVLDTLTKNPTFAVFRGTQSRIFFSSLSCDLRMAAMSLT